MNINTAVSKIYDELTSQAIEAMKIGNFRQARNLLLPYAKESPKLDLLLGIACAGENLPIQAAQYLCLAEKYPFTKDHPCAYVEQFLGPLGKRKQIIPVFRAALKRTPNNSRLLNAFSELLTHLGHFSEAIYILKRSLEITPNSFFAMHQIAIILFEAGKYPIALKIYELLLQKHTNQFSLYANLASYYTATSEFEKALNYYRKAIELNPAFPFLRVNYSISLLKAGYFHQGWIEHEWRFQIPNRTSLPKETLLPTLTPDMDLTGKRILVTHEEGYGDTLMHLRFISPLIKKGAIVELWVADTMEGLCKRIEGNPLVKVGGETPPPFDWHCPFISLPRALSATPETVGKPVPYLTANPNKIIEWKEKLPKTNLLKVGLVWGGAPRPEELSSMMTDRKRSIALYKLASLKKITNICLVSLQMGPYAEQLKDPSFDLEIFDPMDQVRDMEDTAGIIMNLDIIVSVDTSIVHLAGGLGKPVILMDRYDNCWRWMSNSDTSPWYPNVYIIRQTTPRIWSDVVNRVTNKLQKLAKEHLAKKY